VSSVRAAPECVKAGLFHVEFAVNAPKVPGVTVKLVHAPGAASATGVYGIAKPSTSDVQLTIKVAVPVVLSIV